MNTLYLDIFSGISGDMFLGAMIDLGVEAAVINDALQRIKIGDVRIEAVRKVTRGISGIKVNVIEHPKETVHDHDRDDEHSHHGLGHDLYHDKEHLTTHGEHNHDNSANHDKCGLKNEAHGHHHHESRTFRDISELISESGLSDWVKEKSISIFTRIAMAESKIHGCPVDKVHFHEVGAIDSIVDIIGACVALEALGRPEVFSAPVVEGRGFVHCAHGNFPVPAPATLEILSERNIAITQCDEPGELVTPTGAAIIAEFVCEFGLMQGLKPVRVGYGLGSREGKTRPNVLRAVLGEAQKNTIGHDWETDNVAVIETNLDDINPEVLGGFMEKVLAAGALDVYYSFVQMKKNRPGVVLHLLCDVSRTEDFAKLILTETTAFGVRVQEFSRFKLKRKFVTVKTGFGEIKIKEGYLDGVRIQSAPEYEDCKAAALKHGVPLKIVYEAAIKEYYNSVGK
jgi:uncharacterized protein (TIGR00299 family) protein